MRQAFRAVTARRRGCRSIRRSGAKSANEARSASAADLLGAVAANANRRETHNRDGLWGGRCVCHGSMGAQAHIPWSDGQGQSPGTTRVRRRSSTQYRHGQRKDRPTQAIPLVGVTRRTESLYPRSFPVVQLVDQGTPWCLPP